MVCDLLKYTHGGISTVTFVKDEIISANGEKSNIDWYDPSSGHL